MSKDLNDKTLRELIGDPRAVSILEHHLPNLLHHPMIPFIKQMKVKDLLRHNNGIVSQETLKIVLSELEKL